MVVENRFFIKDSLLNSGKFVIEIGQLLTIDKKFSFNDTSSYFECIVVSGNNTVRLLCDQITYNIYTHTIDILITRNIDQPIVGGHHITDDETVTAYLFENDKILFIHDKKEND